MDKKSTEQLLELLKSIDQKEELNSFIEESRLKADDLSFHEYIENHINKKGLSKSEMVKKSLVSRTYAYQILDGRKNPSRDKVIAFCMAAGLDIKETQKALILSQNSELYSRLKRDAIIIFAINNKLNVLSANELLFEMEENTLE
jgi:transcriptional regulator with XRE-family HTH domain